MNELNITPKQKEILVLLYRFRFLNSKQIQEMLGHKNPVRSHAWLSDLADKGYVRGNYKRNVFGENTKPSVFHLTPSSRKILKGVEGCEESVLNLIYKDNRRSQRFIDHCLLLADIYLKYLKESKENGTTLHFLTKSELASYEALPQPLPDAYIAIRDSSGKSSKYFLEVIDRGTPRFALRSKIRKYIDHFNEELWVEYTLGEAPGILFVCQGIKEKLYMRKYAAANCGSEIVLKFFTSEHFGSADPIV